MRPGKVSATSLDVPATSLDSFALVSATSLDSFALVSASFTFVAATSCDNFAAVSASLSASSVSGSLAVPVLN